MRSTRARRSGEVLFGSAGWLFADLMLAVVAMLFLASVISAPPKPPSRPTANTTTPTTTTTTTTPVTTTPAPPPALLPDPLKFDVFVDTEGLLRNDLGVLTTTQQQVYNIILGPLAGRRVGMVLTFGSATTANIQRGIRVAELFNQQVLGTYGEFAGSAYRNFFTNDGDLTKITFEIFVFSS